MIASTRVLNKLESIVKSDMPLAEQNTIVRDKNGQYDVFGLYQIQANKHGALVTRNTETVKQFGSVKSAVSWCIAEKYKQYNLARDIERSDNDVVRIWNDVSFSQTSIAKTKDFDAYIISQNKLENKKTHLSQAQQRLEKCVNLAKYFQIRGFNDELARTRRQAPNPTNRQGYRKPVWAKD